MRYLDVLNVELLKVTAISCSTKLSPVVPLELGRVPLVDQLTQRLHQCIMCRIQEIRNRKPLTLRIHHHSVLHALILVVAPNLSKTSIYITSSSSETHDHRQSSKHVYLEYITYIDDISTRCGPHEDPFSIRFPPHL